MSIRVAVIGAGAAGLCAVRHLSSRPETYTFSAFEQSNQIGGTWVYTDEIGTDSHGNPIHSSMYKNLVTNLPKEVMAFPDFPFDENLPSFVSHEEVLGYLEQYATHFDLYPFIKFQTQVVKVEPVSVEKAKSRTGLGQLWKVTTVDLTCMDHSVTEEYDAVLVCNGHYAIPFIPNLPGLEAFKGEVMHSHNYRSPNPFEGKVVLCLGAGSSGQDISLDLSKTAQLVYLCHNKPLLLTKFPVNVIQKPGISRVLESSVILNNGDEISVDCILLCTGYHFNFPFLTESCHLHIENERITPLYKHLIHTELPSLSFIGICKIICPFPQFHVQVQYILAVLEGFIQLPTKEEMDADTDKDFQGRLAEGLSSRQAHTMGVRQWGYAEELTNIAGCPNIPLAVKNLFHMVHAKRAANLMEYKKDNFVIINDEPRIKM